MLIFPSQRRCLILLILLAALVNASPCLAQSTEKKSTGFFSNLKKGWGEAKTDFKNLKGDVLADIKNPQKKKDLANQKKLISKEFKESWKHVKPKPAFTKKEIKAHDDYITRQKILISKTKANKKPVKEGIYIIDTKKVTTGYSKEFEIVRKKLKQGEFDQLDPFYDQYYASFKEKYGDDQAGYLVREDKDLLRIYERASMYLYSGDYDSSINAFALSEELTYPKGVSSQLSSSLVGMLAGFAESLSGIEELSPYKGTSWENILALNYKTIAHLLKGERSAYNVTRRAIDIQNKERDLFKQKLKSMQKINKKHEKKIKKSDFQAFGLVLNDMVNEAYEKPNIKGQEVLSAYVNPLGFYLAGIVQEYDAFDDPSLSTNALISYKKAAELNPKSATIKSTIKDIEKNGVNTSRQTIHVLLANGFAPEKKVLQTRFLVGENIVLIKLPVQEQRYPTARTVEVYNGKTRLATMGKIADIEAIALRHQADLEPRNQARARFAAWRALGGSKLLSFMGKFNEHSSVLSYQIRQDLEERKTPDMRAWLSLPEEFLGARLRVSKKIKYLTLVTKNRSGKVIAKKTVKLNRDGANFVFARAMGGNLTVRNNQDHWIKW